MSPLDIAVAKKTSRTNGAVGANAVVPRTVRSFITLGDKVLDYGAGKDAAHAAQLRAEGHDVTAYDLWAVPGIHDLTALTREYDATYASNVLNVQNSAEAVEETLVDVRLATKVGGVFVANLPQSPRKGAFAGMTSREGGDWMEAQLRRFFSSVTNVGSAAAPLFVCY